MLTTLWVLSSPWMPKSKRECCIGAAGEACSSSNCCWDHLCANVMPTYPPKHSAATQGCSTVMTWISTIGSRTVRSLRMDRWIRLSRLSVNGTPAEGPLDLAVDLHIGRLRRLQAAIVVCAGCAAGWLWLGNSGAALLGLWAWSLWPRWKSQRITVRFGSLRYARFAASRVFWVERPFVAKQVFVDEVSGAQYAKLRRELKFRLGRSG